ncbi:hypothetical protein H2201_002476 [Coniosporium apollinis]|uniref:Flavoprotein domain-containing protein n=2 Tax=Coniosporium TaxID=2810619 RepID=A0ABQ9NY20_9PEZI|nr:hypothetical protein H2199_006010 [Cladosporium sp. JES 115]KAJ9667275.1 hypothetical protein H2201_002476 [Coniosporium apollinis]
MSSAENHGRPPHILVASACPVTLDFEANIKNRLLKLGHVSLTFITDAVTYSGNNDIWPVIAHFKAGRQCRPLHRLADAKHVQYKAAELCAWADMLILAPIDADNLAAMLQGRANNMVLEIIRSWNVSKKIFLVPGMSCSMWENPMTKKQLSKLRRKWNWVQVMQPQLWTFESNLVKPMLFDGLEEVVEAVQNQIDLMTIGHDIVPPVARSSRLGGSARSTARNLPPELWSMILDFTGDWELAKALGVFTTLPAPPEWRQASSKEGPQTLMQKIEWAILTGTLDELKVLLDTGPVPRWLSRSCVQVLMRFAMIPHLIYLETSHKDLFWATFGHSFLPDKSSSVFGKIELLDYWHTSPTFLAKEYTAEALDGASKAGFVHVLDWWHRSGLPLKYTEAALEQASSKGYLEVLEWWKNASTSEPGDTSETHPSRSSTPAAARADMAPQTQPRVPLRLKPGKSISLATQHADLPVLRWWAASSIPFPHEDTITRLASHHGYVSVLDFWHEVRGEKLVFDNQVLVGATKMGHAAVLEWWKQSGLRVEYKTCDIEEALEDGVEGRKGEDVRRWWARNGLNLGVGTSEWMRTRVLAS